MYSIEMDSVDLSTVLVKLERSGRCSRMATNAHQRYLKQGSCVLDTRQLGSWRNRYQINRRYCLCTQYAVHIIRELPGSNPIPCP